MKTLFSVLSLLVCLSLNAQNKPLVQRPTMAPLVNEFGVAINSSTIKDVPALGFGFGFHRIVRYMKPVNLVIGWEYQRTYAYSDGRTTGANTKTTNRQFKLNNFAIPLLVRFTSPGRNRLFIEMGPSIELFRGHVHPTDVKLRNHPPQQPHISHQSRRMGSNSLSPHSLTPNL